MTDETRTLPLTPTMRAALEERTTGMLRRMLPLLLVFVLLLVPLLGIVAQASGISVMLALALPLAILGIIFLIAGSIAAYERSSAARALRVGLYAAHTGTFQIVSKRLDSSYVYTLHVAGSRLPIAVDPALDLEQFAASGRGTVLFVPTANLLLAVWDGEGNCRYTADSYDLDGDPAAVRPAGVAAPARGRSGAAARSSSPDVADGIGARAGVVLDWLSRSTAPVLVLGVLLIVLAAGAGAASLAEDERARTHATTIAAVAFSPDGRWVATSGARREVRLWEAASGRLIWTVQIDDTYSPADSMVFSPDGTVLAVAASRLSLREVATGRQLRELADIGPVQFTPDGAWLLGGRQRWSVATWQATPLALGPAPERPDVFTPDGRFAAGLVFRTGKPRAIEVWDLTRGEQRLALSYPKANPNDLGIDFALSPDGRWMVIAEPKRLAIYEVATGQLARTITALNVVSDPTFSPDGARIAGESSGQGLVQWDFATGKLLDGMIGLAGSFSLLGYSADGTTLAVSSERLVTLYDARTGAPRVTLRGRLPYWPFP